MRTAADYASKLIECQEMRRRLRYYLDLTTTLLETRVLADEAHIATHDPEDCWRCGSALAVAEARALANEATP